MSQRSRQVVADGSSLDDRVPTVTIDRTNTAEKWRYTCPEGHTDWSPTNQHLWCYTCSRHNEHGKDVDPEFWSLSDQKTGEEIPWAVVEVITPEEKQLQRAKK